MKKKYYFLFWLSCCSLAIVFSLHPSNFERTKAEDTDAIYSSENLNVSSSCDMTSQFCDINCCSDKDCSEQEKRSFECSTKEYNSSKFSYLDCENLGSLNSLGNPLLCLHDQNSPYLGDFYENKNENFSSLSFSEILTKRNKEISSFRTIDMLENSYTNKYRYGLSIFLLDTEGIFHNINIFSNILSKGNGYCSEVPIRFLIDETSTCLFHMDEEQCLLNEKFHLQYHINILQKLELLGDINNVNITYSVVCLRDEAGFISFHKNVFPGMTSKSTFFHDITQCGSHDAITELDENKTTCKNVVVGLNYTIILNGTVITSVKVTILTVNIPLNIKGQESLNEGMRKHLHTDKINEFYSLQKTSVKFEQSDFVGNVEKHGYALGKPVFLRG